MKNLVSKKSPKLSILKRIKNVLLEIDLIYYASDLASDMEIKSTREMDEVLRKAMNVCVSEGVPIEENFKLVYKSTKKETFVDYKLSAFAYKLICLNRESYSFYVKELQATLS